MIIDKLTKSNFIQRFREVRPDNFTYTGLEALYDYYDDLSEDTGTDIEFDPIAICCDWSEYKSFDEALKYYTDCETKEEFADNHYVIELENGGLLVAGF